MQTIQIFFWVFLTLGFVHPVIAMDQQKLCTADLGDPVTLIEGVSSSLSLDLTENIVDFLRDEAKKFGCVNMHTTGYSIRDTYFYIAEKLENAEAIKEKLRQLDWGKSDFSNRLRKGTARARIFKAFEIIRDELRPDLPKDPVTTADEVNAVVRAYRALSPDDSYDVEPAKRRTRTVNYRGDSMPLRELSDDPISFSSAIATRYKSELNELANSYSGVVLRAYPYEATILSSRNPTGTSKRYYLAATSHDLNGHVTVQELKPLGSDSAPLIWAYWGNAANELGIKNKKVVLSYNRKSGGKWEGPVQIPADVFAKIKFKNGINIEQIENWINRYQLESLIVIDKVAQYHLTSKDNLPELKMKAVIKDGVLTMTDLDLK